MAEDDLDAALECVVQCMSEKPEGGLPLSMHPIISIEREDTFRGPDGRLWEVVNEDEEHDEVQLELVNASEKMGFSRAGLSKKAVDGPWEKVIIVDTKADEDEDEIVDHLRTLLEASPEVTRTQLMDAVQLYRSRRDDPDLDVSLHFLVDHALEDAGVPREDRLAITEEITDIYD